MKNLNVANLDGLPREECDKVLLEMVKHLKHCKYASGKEGTVYFVSDKYIVKKYENDAMWVVLNELFEAYCEENKRFADNGYSVPKIYSWLKIPRAHNIFESRYSSSYDYDYDFYVLEERAEGRELYYS